MLNSPSRFDPVEFLATAVVNSPDLSHEEFSHELRLMFQRNQATAELIAGNIDLDTYENILEATNVDPINFHLDWVGRMDNLVN